MRDFYIYKATWINQRGDRDLYVRSWTESESLILNVSDWMNTILVLSLILNNVEHYLDLAIISDRPCQCRGNSQNWTWSRSQNTSGALLHVIFCLLDGKGPFKMETQSWGQRMTFWFRKTTDPFVISKTTSKFWVVCTKVFKHFEQPMIYRQRFNGCSL